MIKKIHNFIRLDKSFIQSSILVFIANMGVSVLNYVFRALSGRFLTASEYGKVGFLIAMISLITVFSNSVNNLVAKFTSESIAKKAYGQIKSLYKKLTTYAIYMGGAVWIVFILLGDRIGLWFKVDPIYIRFAGAGFLFLLVNTVTRGILQGKKEFKKFSLINVCESVIKLTLFLILFYFGARVSASLGALLGSMALILIVLQYYTRNGLVKEVSPISINELKKYFSFAFVSLGLFALLVFIDVPLAKYFLSETEAGYYTVLSDLGKIIFYAITPLMVVMFPVISEYYTKGKKHYHLLIQTIGLIFLLGIPALLIYYFFPELIIRTLFGEKYLVVSNYLFWSGLAMFVLVLCNMFVQYFLSIKNMKVYLYLLIDAFLVILLFVFRHQNMSDIVFNILIGFSILLLMLVLMYIIGKRDRLVKIFNK